MSLPDRALPRLLAAARAAASDEAPLLQRYELRQELGRGGMGVVYAAFDTELGRDVAVKLLAGAHGLSDAARARFVREARAAARLNHPNIAAVYDASDEAIVMQRVDGPTLERAAIEDPRVLASLVRDAALALHYAHAQGVVHRDVKPSNLMVEPGPPARVIVTDFGLAQETRDVARLSTTGALLGTPAFMAPEQARSGPTDARTDVYGLGVTLYACLAGRPPFERADVVQTLRAVAEDEPTPLPRTVPRDLAIVVRKAMTKEPERRYPSALGLASDLDRWLSGLPVEARPPSLLYLARRHLSRRRGVLLGALAASLLGALVFVPAWRASRQRARLAEDALALSDVVAATLQNVRTFRETFNEPLAEEALARAIARCEAFLAERAEVGRVYDFLGRLREQTGDVAGARRAFDRALQLDPGLATVRVDRGVLLALQYGDHIARQDLDAAPLEDVRRAALADLAQLEDAGAGIGPTRALFARGLRAQLEGRNAEAERWLLEVTELDDVHHDAFLSLSRLYVAEGRDEEAMRASVRAADLLRGHAVTYRARRDHNGPLAAGGGDLGAEPRALAGLDELVYDFGAAFRARPTTATSLAARGLERLRDAAFEAARDERGEALRLLDIAVSELDGAFGAEPRPEYALCRGVCHALRARILDAAAQHAGGRQAQRAASDDYERAAELGEDPVLLVARGLLDLRRAASLVFAGEPTEASSRQAAGASSLRRAAALLADRPELARHVRALSGADAVD
ncbi:MAG: protein kinase [Planctomycetota bacterium]